MSSEAESVVNEFCKAWARLNIDQVMDFFTDDAVYHNIPMKPATGKAEIRKTVEGAAQGHDLDRIQDSAHRVERQYRLQRAGRLVQGGYQGPGEEAVAAGDGRLRNHAQWQDQGVARLLRPEDVHRPAEIAGSAAAAGGATIASDGFLGYARDFGTAGHIDHGKTALIKALTGQDTDRLKEEKERGISIDLGFAYFTLPDGMRAGVVDVPGHERFIRNMLAGAHGIDLVLFTIAADDGVMPQSEEHLDILHLLGITRGIFVITKADLASSQRIGEVGEEIELLAEGTALAKAPVIAVSSLNGSGLDQLRGEIARQIEGFQARRATGLFRLPLDRAFVIKGHGTVVTGTAMGAEVRVGRNCAPCRAATSFASSSRSTARRWKARASASASRLT